MAKQCHQCKYYVEDNFCNWATCEVEENWPEHLTEKEIDDIIMSNNKECPVFQLSEEWLVYPQFACKCGECRIDYLEWINDDEVKCLTCDNVYKPYKEMD